MKIIKRNGAEATFDISKIIMAVTKANAAVEEGARMTPRQIQRIAEMRWGPVPERSLPPAVPRPLPAPGHPPPR